MKRKIYYDLMTWKNDYETVKPLMILGARQIGKTYIINEFCKSEFKNYVYINFLENNELRNLYSADMNSEERFRNLKMLLGIDLEIEGTIIFADEVQESEVFISELKFLCENHNDVRVVCAGSLLGVKLKRSHFSFPVGKVKMINMFPMDFEEFLIANDQEMLIEAIKISYNENKSMGLPIHSIAMNWYKKYNITGGMPESVKNFIAVDGDYIKYDTSIVKNIIDSYFNDMSKYVSSDSETLKIKRLYNSIPSQIANESKKFQYSKIISGGRMRDYELPLDWLLESNIVYLSSVVSNPQIPIKAFEDVNTFKLFINDIGILNSLLEVNYYNIINDNLGIYKGLIAENYVANQLVYNGINLHYWKSDNKAEVDFLIADDNGVIPIEVKAGENTQSKSLGVYKTKYSPAYSIRVSGKDFGYNEETRIKSVPLYAVFCIK